MHVDLAQDLRVADVLGRIVVEDVEHDRDHDLGRATAQRVGPEQILHRRDLGLDDLGPDRGAGVVLMDPLDILVGVAAGLLFLRDDLGRAYPAGQGSGGHRVVSVVHSWLH
ncbi:MAG: hypothetical protein AAF628_29670 [Planctomycetota bacterium]